MTATAVDAPGGWTTGHTISAAGVAVVLLLAGAGGLWTLAVQAGRAQVAPPDPTIGLRSEMTLLQTTLNELRGNIATLSITAQRLVQTEADLRRVEADVKEARRVVDDRDKEQLRLLETVRGAVGDHGTRLTVIERASERALPGSPALRR